MIALNRPQASALLLHRTMALVTRRVLGTNHQARVPTKFAGQLSGARHFKVLLYPIEGHLAWRGSCPNWVPTTACGSF
jgi:hypothetical protein